MLTYEDTLVLCQRHYSPRKETIYFSANIACRQLDVIIPLKTNIVLLMYLEAEKCIKQLQIKNYLSDRLFSCFTLALLKVRKRAKIRNPDLSFYEKTVDPDQLAFEQNLIGPTSQMTRPKFNVNVPLVLEKMFEQFFIYGSQFGHLIRTIMNKGPLTVVIMDSQCIAAYNFDNN